MIWIVMLAFLIFATGVIIGATTALERATEDMIDTFAETQHIRDENKWLRERMDPSNKLAMVAYLCDGKACKACYNPDCHHTFDIRHARNFELVGNNKYAERVSKEN